MDTSLASEAALATKRQETMHMAFEAAARVARSVKVGFRFYQAER